LALAISLINEKNLLRDNITKYLYCINSEMLFTKSVRTKSYLNLQYNTLTHW